MPDPSLTAPADWAAIVFGQYDAVVVPYHAPFPQWAQRGYVGPDWPPPTFVGGRQVNTGPAPAIWRTNLDYHQSHLDIVLGRPEVDSPTWLSAGYLRELGLQYAHDGIAFGVVPLTYLTAITIPGDFTADEILAQSVASAAFASGVPIPFSLPGASHDFWPRSLAASPLASLPSWAQSAAARSIPVSLVGTLTSSLVLTLTRESLPILAAARAQGVRELPLWIVYA